MSKLGVINLNQMIKTEMLKLSPDEFRIVIAWRILDYPKRRTVKQLAADLDYSIEFINETLNKFNKNVRAKLELAQQEDNLQKVLMEIFCFRERPNREKKDFDF